MTIVAMKFRLMITSAIRNAKQNSAISQPEAEFLQSMAKNSLAASSTMMLLSKNGAPDFLYSALHFATMIWQTNEASGREFEAQAGYLLAQYVLKKESPAHDPCWAVKLLRELYEAHAELQPDTVASVA